MRKKHNFLLFYLTGLFLTSLVFVFPSATYAQVSPSPTVLGTYEIIIRPDPGTQDKYVVNQATAQVIGAKPGTGPGGPSGPPPSADYVPPNDNNCGGKYSSDIARNQFLKKNFGDPQCNFTKDQLYTLLKAQDPANAEWWYHVIVPCESSYDPNVWVPATPPLDPQGPWGLFQDGSSKPPGSPPPSPGLNGPFDRGDVNWTVQISNAVQLLKSQGTSYWGCRNHAPVP